MVKVNFHNIAVILVERLKKEGIGCYIWHKATTGSAYIRFDDNRMGSIRLGDHPGRSKLRYRYNIRSDIKMKKHNKWENKDGIWRLYIHASKLDDIIPHLLKSKEKIKEFGPSKYEYTIPKFKQNK